MPAASRACVLEADAKLQGGRVIAPDAAPARGDQVVTQVFRLQYESATNLVPVLRPLIAPNNTIAAYAANNTLVITDYADNLRRIARIIEDIDSPATSDVEVIPMKYGIASDIAAIVNKVLDEGARSAGQAVDAGQRVLVQAETRSNSLILRAASRARLEQAKDPDRPIRPAQRDAGQHQRHLPAQRPGHEAGAAVARRARLRPHVCRPNGQHRQPLGRNRRRAAGRADRAYRHGQQLRQRQHERLLVEPGRRPAAAGVEPRRRARARAGSASGAGNDRSGLAGMIQADPATNSLIITAPASLYRNIVAIVDKLDARPAQVLVESLVVELSGDNASEFGIQWQALNGLNSTNTSVIGGTNFGGSSQNIISAATSLGNLGAGLNIGVIQGSVNIPGIGTVTNMSLLARALETTANANILERPNIQTLDNEEGKFLVGQNVPFVTGSYANTGTTTTTTTGSSVTPFQTYERHDVGLLLRVKPQISEGGSVRMTIYIEDSSVSAGTSGTDLILNKRMFETNVVVQDGNFIVISGMIQDQTNENQYKVPLLGDIPWLGALFRYDTREHIEDPNHGVLAPDGAPQRVRRTHRGLDRYDYIRNELANAAPAHNLVLRDMNFTTLGPMPEKEATGAATQRILVATASDSKQAQQIQHQLHDLGMDSHRLATEPVVGTNGDSGKAVRIIASVVPAEADRTLVLLRGLGFTPTLMDAAGGAAPTGSPHDSGTKPQP